MSAKIQIIHKLTRKSFITWKRGRNKEGCDVQKQSARLEVLQKHTLHSIPECATRHRSIMVSSMSVCVCGCGGRRGVWLTMDCALCVSHTHTQTIISIALQTWNLGHSNTRAHANTRLSLKARLGEKDNQMWGRRGSVCQLSPILPLTVHCIRPL